MKNYTVLIVACTLITMSLSSCATIVGGAKYNAKVQVPGHPEAKITVNGLYRGKGEALFKVYRRDADKLSITIQEDNYEQETTYYTGKKFRGWSFIGTIIGWTGSFGGIPLPWGILVDASTGAWWSPDISEKGIIKQDYDNYVYIMDYNAVPLKEQAIIPTKTPSDVIKIELLRELKELVDEGILTQEEYEKEKTKILNQHIF